MRNDIMDNEMEQWQKSYNLNLEKLPSFSFTEPISFRFSRCQPQTIESWKDLYGGVLKHLAQKCFERIQTAIPTGEIGDLKASKKMKAPYWIRRGVYVETGLNTETIIKRIKDVLAASGLKSSDLKIIYYIDEERKQAYEERIEREKSGQKILQLRWDYTGSYKGARPISFRFKNHRTKPVKSWSDLYIQFISFLADDYPRIIKDGVSFGDTRIDVCKAGKKKNAMQHPVRIGHNLFVETFGTSSMLIDRMYSALSLCKVDPSALIINFIFKDVDKSFEYLGKTSRVGTGIESEAIEKIDGRLVRRLRFLLNKNYENGYRLESAIDRNRLYTFYEEQYKEPLNASEEELKIALLTIANPIGGRIMPKKQATISKLMKSIMVTLADTFASGATCIYTSELMKLFNEELMANGIHDEKSLEELILNNSGNVYRIQYNRICYGRQKADVESEIIGFLRDCGVPQTIEEIAGNIWYISQPVLERELANSEVIVSPTGKTYYYALNLPIKSAERNLIKETLRSFLTIRQTMTEIEFLDAVLQICPNLLTEASFLSWKGMEDSLLYLFRDVVVIRNNQIIAR